MKTMVDSPIPVVPCGKHDPVIILGNSKGAVAENSDFFRTLKSVFCFDFFDVSLSRWEEHRAESSSGLLTLS